jgi:hypothetical protein
MSNDDSNRVRLSEVSADGSRQNYYKRIEELTPEECASLTHQLAQKALMAQADCRRRHEVSTRLHGHKYLRLLKLDLAAFLPPEPDAASA